MRIGHSRVTHSYIFEGTSPPECDFCRVHLTIEHILVDCDMLQDKRCFYHLDNKTLEVLLGESTNVEDIMNFLKETDFYFKLNDFKCLS